MACREAMNAIVKIIARYTSGAYFQIIAVQLQ